MKEGRKRVIAIIAGILVVKQFREQHGGIEEEVAI
jgi:hypothetical protein